MKLNKWMIAGTGVLVVAGVAPWGVGYVTEQQWFQATAEVNAAQPFVRMETDRYQRGMLGAEASGTVTLIDPSSGDQQQIDFRLKVTHGVTGSLLDFEPAQGWQPEGAGWFPEAEPTLTLETRLWGSATLELEAPPMTFEQVTTGESLKTGGGLVRASVGRLGEQVDLLLVWPTLVLSAPDRSLSVEDVQLEQSLSWLSGDLWTGAGTMTVESLSLRAAGAEPVVMNGLALHSDSQARDQERRLDSSLELDVDSVSYSGEAYGPHRMAVSVDGVDVAGWNAFSSAMTELQSLAVSGAAGVSSFEQQMAVMQRFNESIRDLAAAGFSAGIRELSLETPEGPVQGSLDISHPELSGTEKDAMLMVMQGLTGELDFSMPMALAEDYAAVRMQVAPLIKQGLLVQEGERLVMGGRMAELVLDINDLQIPLPPLL